MNKKGESYIKSQKRENMENKGEIKQGGRKNWKGREDGRAGREGGGATEKGNGTEWRRAAAAGRGHRQHSAPEPERTRRKEAAKVKDTLVIQAR